MQKSSKPKARRTPDRVHLRLTLDLHYQKHGVSERYLRDELEHMVEHAAGAGAFTGESEAKTEQWKFRIENVAQLKPRTRTTREQKLLAVAKASHVGIGEALDKSGADPVDAARWLDGLTQQAAFAAAYAEARGGSGCGDAGHDEAVKDAERQLKKVRKALGFTYP